MDGALDSWHLYGGVVSCTVYVGFWVDITWSHDTPRVWSYDVDGLDGPHEYWLVNGIRPNLGVIVKSMSKMLTMHTACKPTR